MTLTAFLRTIIAERGCNSHAWLVDQATRLLPEVARLEAMETLYVEQMQSDQARKDQLADELRDCFTRDAEFLLREADNR